MKKSTKENLALGVGIFGMLLMVAGAIFAIYWNIIALIENLTVIIDIFRGNAGSSKQITVATLGIVFRVFIFIFTFFVSLLPGFVTLWVAREKISNA